jgi:uncharacterized protein
VQATKAAAAIGIVRAAVPFATDRRRDMTGRQRSSMRRDGSFDAFDVAARGLELSGNLDPSTLARISDRLAEGSAGLKWRIAGAADARGHPALEVSLDGEVPLECQRCLRPFSWQVEQRTLLLLAHDEHELARLDGDDEHEVIAAAAPVDALALVEDELLLTLPFAPHCERDDCGTVASAGAGEGSAESPAARTSAFDALAGLKANAPKKPEG